MKEARGIEHFLSRYDPQVISNALETRKILLANLPEILEQIDIPAKMIAYCYGQKYTDMVCALTPSKKGLKLGFYRGAELPDPEKMLEGTGKISRYIEIRSATQIKSPALKTLLADALTAYRTRVLALKQ